MDFLFYMVAGATVGLAVGLTGVGGGSLMTPILLAFGFPLHIAVGTDLMFAAVTKSGGLVVHTVQKSVRWDLVILLAAGSIPGTVLTIVALDQLFDSPQQYASLITSTLGVTLLLTSATILFRRQLGGRLASRLSERTVLRLTPLLGLVLGVLVTLSSVGAGAIATALLLVFYPALRALNVVGTDIAHAVPLTLVAGLGHLYLGNVDLVLLVALLAGSLPAVSIGARFARFVPDRVMRPLLATMLAGIGIKFAFF